LATEAFSDCIEIIGTIHINLSIYLPRFWPRRPGCRGTDAAIAAGPSVQVFGL